MTVSDYSVADHTDILRIGEFHRAIRNSDHETVAAMLEKHPELCYQRQNGRAAIHIATESLNPVALKLLFEAEKNIPSSIEYKLRESGDLPVIFQRIHNDHAEHAEVLQAINNKTALEMLMNVFSLKTPEVLAIKDKLERMEEAALSELLGQLRGDASSKSPYQPDSIKSIEQFGSQYVPRIFSIVDPANPQDISSCLNIRTYVDADGRVHNVPVIDDNGRPTGVVGVDGVTPLHVATLAGDKTVVGKILEGNTDAGVKNSFGLTAADMATVMGRAHGRVVGSEHVKAAASVDSETIRQHQEKAAKHEEKQGTFNEIASELKAAERGSHSTGHASRLTSSRMSNGNQTKLV